MKQTKSGLYACLLTVAFLLLPQYTSMAQNTSEYRVDSLLKLLPEAKEDTNKVLLYNSLASTYRNIDPDKGIQYAIKAQQLATQLDWQAGKALTYNTLGINYAARADYPQALNSYLKALDINEKTGNKKGMASNLANIGIVYQNSNNYPKALANLQRALKINLETDNKKGIANNLVNMSNIYDILDSFPKELEYLSWALKINTELGNKNDIAANMGAIGTYYSSQNNFGEALAYNFKALRMHTELGNKNGRAINLGNIGEIYSAIACRPQGSVKQDSLISGSSTANLRKAITYLQNGIAASREIGFLKGVMKFSKSLSKAYSIGGEDKKALAAYQQYMQIHDSVFSAENNTKIKQIENRYDKELKDKTILLADKEIQIAKLDIQRKANRTIFYISALGLLLIVIFFIGRERKKTEILLLNILPKKIADRLKKKEHPIADHFTNVSIMFIDMAGFTEFAETRHPKDTVRVLNDVFTHFDALAEKHCLEKIKTIGDCYMAVAGVPEPNRNHAIDAVKMALEIKQTMKGYKTKDGTFIHFRIGLDCGPVVAGVIGKKKFIYDLWGDAVNTASRMETSGIAGEIHCTDNFKREIEYCDTEKKLNITFQNRGMVEVRSKGQMQTWLIS